MRRRLRVRTSAPFIETEWRVEQNSPQPLLSLPWPEITATRRAARAPAGVTTLAGPKYELYDYRTVGGAGRDDELRD